MRLDALLSELGPKVREALEARGSAVGRPPSPLAVARAAAGQGKAYGLPPALHHDAALLSANLLWGRLFKTVLGDSGYQDGEYALPDDARLLGGLVMEVGRGIARAAQLYLRSAAAAAAEEAELYVLVDEAPLGAMEAELFERQRAPSEFETMWFKDDAQGKWLVRTGDVAEELRAGAGNCGLGVFPPFLLGGTYYIVRPGVLPLLRLRKPATAGEHEAVARAIAHTAARRGAAPPELAAWIFDVPVRATTIFQARRVPHKPVTAEAEPAPPPALLLTPLARIVLFALHDAFDEYIGVEHAPPQSQSPPFEQLGDEGVARIFDAAMADEAAAAPKPLPDGFNAEAIEWEMRTLAWRTGRVCEPRPLGESALPDDAPGLARCIVDALFTETDADLLRHAMDGMKRPSAGEVPALSDYFNLVGRMLRAEQLIVFCYVGAEGLVTRTSVSGGGVPLHYALNLDDVCRLVLCPWVTLVVVDTVSTPQQAMRLAVGGVRPLQLELSEAARTATLVRASAAAAAAAAAVAPPAAAVSQAAIAAAVSEAMATVVEQFRGEFGALKQAVEAAAAAPTTAVAPTAAAPPRAEPAELRALRAAHKRLAAYDAAVLAKANRA